MSMSINEAVTMKFGEVTLGKFEINSDFNLSTSITLASGETGKISVFLGGDDNWHYIVAIDGIIEGGKFNEGANNSFNEMYLYLSTEGGLLQKKAIPMPIEACCELYGCSEVHDNGLCAKCNELISMELGMNC